MKVAMAGWTEAALALATGGAGAFIFWLVGFPMPFLTGPAVAVTLAAVPTVPLVIPSPPPMMSVRLLSRMPSPSW